MFMVAKELTKSDLAASRIEFVNDAVSGVTGLVGTVKSADDVVDMANSMWGGLKSILSGDNMVKTQQEEKQKNQMNKTEEGKKNQNNNQSDIEKSKIPN